MNARPRTAMVCTEMLPVPPVSGGAIQTYIAGVAPYLAQDFELTVFGRRHPALPNEQRLDGVRYVRLPATEGKQAYFRAVAKRLRKQRWDLVEGFNRPRFLAHLVTAAPGARYLLSLHNDMFSRKKLEPVTARWCLRQLSAVVTISEYIAQRVRQLYPRSPTPCIPIRSGVDLDLFKPRSAPRKEAAAPVHALARKLAGRPVVLLVARLSPDKGIDIALRAMREILATHPRTCLLIVGSSWYGRDKDTPYVARIRHLAERLGDAVVLTGYVPYDQVADYFALGDIFLCASQWHEPLARVHYEAMACELPILTTNRGGNAEVVKHGVEGWVLDRYYDPTAFSVAIRRLLQRPTLRRQMGRAGRRRVERDHSWDQVARQLKAAFLGKLVLDNGVLASSQPMAGPGSSRFRPALGPHRSRSSR